MNRSSIGGGLAVPATLSLRLIATLLILAAGALLTGCASTPKVRSDYDRAADFSRYSTYGFVATAGADRRGYQSLATQALQAAVAREMEARGYRRADRPDLLVNYKGRLDEKADIESTPSPMYGRGWAYRGWYGAPAAAYGGDVRTRRYKVGTLVIDVIDRERRQAVFQGSVESVVSKKMLEDRQAAIGQAVATIFTRYPFVASDRTAHVTP